MSHWRECKEVEGESKKKEIVKVKSTFTNSSLYSGSNERGKRKQKNTNLKGKRKRN